MAGWFKSIDILTTFLLESDFIMDRSDLSEMKLAYILSFSFEMSCLRSEINYFSQLSF